MRSSLLVDITDAPHQSINMLDRRYSRAESIQPAPKISIEAVESASPA